MLAGESVAGAAALPHTASSAQADEPNIYEGLRFYINCKITTFKETIIFEAI